MASQDERTDTATGECSENTGRLFDEGDITLLCDALSLHGDLEAAAYLAKIISPHVTFPIESRDELLEALRTSRCKLRMRDRAWTSRDVKRFTPPAVFPIGDQADLLRAALIACSSGHRFHYHEEQARLCCSD